jgi:PAS domain S-box-containing protein
MKGSDLFAAYVQVVETGVPVHLETVAYQHLVGGDEGGERTFAVQVSKFDDGLIVAARDVTARERALESLRVSEARLAEAQRIARLGSWDWESSTGAIAWSEEMYRIYGVEPGHEARTLDETIEYCTPETRDEVRRAMLAGTRDGSPFSLEQKIVRRDGEVRITTVHVEPFFDENGELERVRGTTQDVTEQRAAQEALFMAALELEREQQLVEALQRAILPHDLPDVAGVELSAHYLPASMDVEIGGDWYDVFELSDGRVCLSVGDVAGHGVQSAATMGQLRNAFRAYAHAGFGPAETLHQLDHLLASVAEEEWSCATCLFVEYTPATRRLRWARAGHPHPLIHDGAARELVGAGGPPVGAGLPSYDESEIELHVGNVVLLYTDGLVERPGEILDLGIGRLTDALQATDPGDFSLFATRICTAVLDDRPRRDDICVLALRVTA